MKSSRTIQWQRRTDSAEWSVLLPEASAAPIVWSNVQLSNDLERRDIATGAVDLSEVEGVDPDLRVRYMVVIHSADGWGIGRIAAAHPDDPYGHYFLGVALFREGVDALYLMQADGSDVRWSGVNSTVTPE